MVTFLLTQWMKLGWSWKPHCFCHEHLVGYILNIILPEHIHTLGIINPILYMRKLRE